MEKMLMNKDIVITNQLARYIQVSNILHKAVNCILYFVIIDAFSRWPKVFKMTSTTTQVNNRAPGTGTSLLMQHNCFRTTGPNSRSQSFSRTFASLMESSISNPAFITQPNQWPGRKIQGNSQARTEETST